MRKNLLFFAASVLLFGACETDSGSEPLRPTEPEETPSLVSFAKASVSGEVRKGDSGLEIEVTTTQTSDQARSFDVEVVADATTAADDAYELPAATVVIAAGELSGKFVVKPVYKNLTPDAVTLTLRLDVDAPLVGDNERVEVSLKRYYKLDMAFLTQTWAAQNYLNGQPTSGPSGNPYEITISKGATDNEVLISNFHYAASGNQIKATVDFEKSQLTIGAGQIVAPQEQDWPSPMAIYSVVDGVTNTGNDPIVCPITYKGITVDKYSLFNGKNTFAPCKTILSEKE